MQIILTGCNRSQSTISVIAIDYAQMNKVRFTPHIKQSLYNDLSWTTNIYRQQENNSSRFSSNSEADASELLENPEEMFPWYYMHSNILRMFIYSTTQQSITLYERVKHLYDVILTLCIQVTVTSLQSLVHNSLTITSNSETFLQDFLEILK